MIMQIFLLTEFAFRPETIGRYKNSIYEKHGERVRTSFVSEDNFKQLALIDPEFP